MYDVTCLSTFENIPDWINEVLQFSGTVVNVLLVGNKIDLTEKRVVSYERARVSLGQKTFLFFWSKGFLLNFRNLQKKMI